MPVVAIICKVAFTPWNALWIWGAPLPVTVQEQVDKAMGHGLDGIIVYVDQKGKAPAFYSAGWKNRENKIPADLHACTTEVVFPIIRTENTGISKFRQLLFF